MDKERGESLDGFGSRVLLQQCMKLKAKHNSELVLDSDEVAVRLLKAVCGEYARKLTDERW